MIAEAYGNKDGWIDWHGGGCPVPLDTVVEVYFDQTPSEGQANRWNWDWWDDGDKHSGDITKYRIVSEKPVQISDKEIIPDTNPKKIYGMKSIPLNLWPALASAYGALGLYNGSEKYGRGNYKATPVEASIYIAAAMRHLSAWAEGQEDDPADGVPNLGGVLANIAILLEARANKTLIDDRGIPSGYLDEIEMLREKIAFVQELHKDKNPRHYTIKDKK